MKLKRKERSLIVKALIKRAHKIFLKELKDFMGDREMIKYCVDDFSDFVEIADHIQDGQIDVAMKMIRGLDTASRDRIPNVAWKAYEKWENEKFK